MKVNMRFTLMGLAFFVLLFSILPMGCNNTPSSNADNTAAQEESTQPPEETAAPAAGPSDDAPATDIPEATESPSATSAKTSVPESPAATKTPATTKTSTAKSESKPTEPAPKAAVKTEPDKVKETAAAPAAPKPSQPAVTPAPPAPKPEAVPPPVAEAPKKTETAPKPAAPQASSNWPVPASYNNKANPIKASSASIAAGKSLWSLHCKSCHGKNGLGDGPKAAQLDDHPGDFTTKAFQSQTDGALFYKTLEGKGDMPGFKKKIPDEEDLWNLVNFMRTMK